VHTVSAPRLTCRFDLADEAATIRLGEAFGASIAADIDDIERTGLVVALSGELGSGKTTFVRAALRRLGVTGPVRSPTFALLELYPLSRLNFYHFDFYRFSDPSEFEYLGFRDFFGAGSVCAIEWPERIGDRQLPVDLRLALRIVDAGRCAQAEAITQGGQRCLDRMNRAWHGSRGGDC
jgi:tRNA threonylcarbamoyladenosine biosynthesis protein TsaE